MKLDSAIELKRECFLQSYQEITDDVGLRVNSLGVEPVVGRQVSVGFSRQGLDDYHLELRLDRASGPAYRLAQGMKAKAPKEIHIGVIEKLVVPTPIALANATRDTASAARFAFQKRPLHIGLSIGNLNGGVGSLGAFVEDAKGRPGIVSNCHVLAPPGPGGERDRKIYQPGKQDILYETLRDGHAIATLCDHTTFSGVGSNYLDGAYAILDDPGLADPNGNTIPKGCPGEGTRIEEVVDYDQLAPNQRVFKVGRTTGCTGGTVRAFGVDDRIIDVPPYGNRRFDDLIEVWWDRLDVPFASPGDSGSLLFLADRFAAIALHFAGGILKVDGKRVGISYGCSLPRLLKIFDLTFL